MTTSRTCERCGRPIPLLSRADARYCSGACRVAAHRARHDDEPVIPTELRARDRWIRHRAKVPLTVDGHVASVTDPRTWAPHAAAESSRIGDGLGFVLDGDGIMCVDIDDCLTAAGRLEPWAAPLLAQLPATYIEVSPSGRGLHVWGVGALERGRRVAVDGGRLELYGAGRYLTVTGRRFRSAPSRLGDLSSFAGRFV